MGDTTRRQQGSLVRNALALTITVAMFGSGCAAQQAQARAQQEQELEAMQSRIEEVERTNGRLTVRMEELEDQLFLLNDRVESHRIALQRRAYQERYASRTPTPRAPSRAPESSYYPEDGGYQDRVVQPKPQRAVRRIPLSNGQDTSDPYNQQGYGTQPAAAREAGDDEVVISEDEFRRFAGAPRERSTPSPKSSSSGSSKSTGGRVAQPDVTNEKLATTGGSSKSAAPSATKKDVAAPSKPVTTASSSAPKSKGLRLYKDSLAAYRAGEYGTALAGFEAFLSAGPKADYVDNALYWIGECHYGLGDFTRAVSFFERVMEEQPDGNKVPDAMLKMSLALDQLGNRDRAEQVLETLTQRYPMTNAAQLGAKRLADRQ